MADGPIKVTVVFECADKDAFDQLWKHIREDYAFAEAGERPVRAFAVSMGDTFAEQDAIEAALDSDLDVYDLKECIGELICCADPDAVLAKWEIGGEGS